MKSIYIIGSMRNPRVPEIAAMLRDLDFDVIDDWYSPGPETDDYWKAYERQRGRSYAEALRGHHATHVYTFDRFHLNRAHGAVLVLPAGRSGHLEAGSVSATKPVFMLLDPDGEPERLDIMTQFLHSVHTDPAALKEAIQTYPWPKVPEIPFHTVADALWLAGLFEGDGTFCISKAMPRAVLQMTDRDVVARAARILGGKVWQTGETVTKKKVYACGAAGLTAIEWMRILRPYMGQRRQNQIVTTVQIWLDKRKYNTRDRDWWSRAFRLEEQIR